MAAGVAAPAHALEEITPARRPGSGRDAGGNRRDAGECGARDNLFELGPIQGANILGDGNAANGPDWADIFNTSGSPVRLGTFGGVAASFILDDNSQKGASDRTTFSGAGGSNKNNDPISNADCTARVPPLTGSACDTWHWDSGNVPAKDDLSNVYAYGAFAPDGDLIIYAGFERLAPEGSRHLCAFNSSGNIDGGRDATSAVVVRSSQPVPERIHGVRRQRDRGPRTAIGRN